jgi:hypothetical protein
MKFTHPSKLASAVPGALLVALLAGLLPGAAPAQGNDPAPKATRGSRLPVDSLKRGAQWENHGTAYAVVPEVRAVLAAGQEEAPEAALARQGIAGGTVLERKGGFVLYKAAPGARPLAGSSATALVAGQADPRPVVLNLRTRKLAVVLNSVRAELKDAGSNGTAAAEALAADLGITLGKQFPNRPVVYFAVPAGMDLIALVGKLRGDPRVAKADLELIEYVRTVH